MSEEIKKMEDKLIVSKLMELRSKRQLLEKLRKEVWDLEESLGI